jgi:K+ channel tetramerisation domain./TLD.
LQLTTSIPHRQAIAVNKTNYLLLHIKALVNRSPTMKTKKASSYDKNAKEDKKAISSKIENLDKVLDTSIASLFDQHNQIKKRNKDIIERQEALLRKHGGGNVKPSDIIVLNVRGEEMFARRDTLTLIQDSRLEALFSGRWENQLLRDEQGRVFMDVDPGAFRRILEYLYMIKIASPEQGDLSSKNKEFIASSSIKQFNGSEENMEDKLYALYFDFFKLGLAGGPQDGTTSTGTVDKIKLQDGDSHNKEHKEVELLKAMKLELDKMEKKLESEESFVALFTNKANKPPVSTKQTTPDGDEMTAGSIISVDSSMSSNGTTGTEGETCICPANGLINLYVNGEILMYKFSSITAFEKSKLTKNLTNAKWRKEHSINPTIKGGQQCILMEYPRKEFKELLNYIHMENLCLGENHKVAPLDLLPASSVTDNFLILAKYFHPCSKEDLHHVLSIKGTLHESTIVSSKDHIAAIEKWLQSVNKYSKLRLLYRASLHGNTARDFHTHCDKKGPTITIIKTGNGSIFGGYRHISWGAPDEPAAQDDSFLFSLALCNANTWSLESSPHKMNNRKSNTQGYNTLNSQPSQGPVFGNSYNGSSGDLRIDYQNGRCYVNSCLGKAYNYHPSGSGYSHFLTSGNPQCAVTDYEVYGVEG